jgi:hypothetical protein
MWAPARTRTFLTRNNERALADNGRVLAQKGAHMRRFLVTASLVALGVAWGTPAKTSSAPMVMAEPAALNKPAPSAAQIASQEKAAQSIETTNTKVVHAAQTAKAASKPATISAGSVPAAGSRSAKVNPLSSTCGPCVGIRVSTNAASATSEISPLSADVVAARLATPGTPPTWPWPKPTGTRSSPR